VLRLEVPAQRVTRAMGDVHAQGNPHYWLDPLNGRIVAKAIAGRLEQIDPFNAASYRANLAQFQKALDERMFGTELVSQIGGDKLWAIELKGSLGEFLEKGNLAGKLGGWAAAVKPLRAQKIVTYHKSWVYFANRFGLAIDCELEPKPGIPPSPSHLARVIERINGGGIRVILLEPFYSRKAADFVAGKTSATTVVCPNSVGGNDSATDYLSLIDTIVDRVSKAFTER